MLTNKNHVHIVVIAFSIKWNIACFIYGLYLFLINLNRGYQSETDPDPRPDYLHTTPTIDISYDPTISIFHTVGSVYSKLNNTSNR